MIYLADHVRDPYPLLLQVQGDHARPITAADHGKETTMTECYACRHNDQPPAALPPRERIFDNGLWRVAHAFSSALPGWMVVIPRRHILSLSELTASEATSLGPLLTALSKALEHGLGAPKAYVAFFAEADGFAHLHVHVIPRSDDLPDEHRGPHIFRYLEQSPDQWVGSTAMDQLADRLCPLLAEQACDL